MVVLEGLGIDVSVISQGRKAPEHEDPSPDPAANPDPGFTTVVNKYIEVTNDAEFSIGISVGDRRGQLWALGNTAVTAWCHVDGHKGSGRNFNGRHHHSQTVDGVRMNVQGENHSTLRRYRFKTVETVDEANRKRVEKDAETAKDLGLIQVKIWRTDYVGDAYDTTQGSPTSVESLSLAEKALKGKAISHGTSLGAAERIPKALYQSVNYLDTHPIAIVNLKYRSREALHNELIIPRSPSPAAEAELQGLSPNRIRALAMERLADMRVKNENKSGISNSRVKREYDLTQDENLPPARPLKISKSASGQETIDLTDD